MTPSRHRYTGRPGTVPALRLVLDSVSHGDFPEPFRWTTHHHLRHELILPETGTYRCRIGGRLFSARPGELVVIEPGDDHEDPLDTPVRYLACTFHLASAPEQRLLTAAAPRVAPADPQLHAALAAALPGGDAWAWRILDALLSRHLVGCLSGLPEPALAPHLRATLRGDALAQRITAVMAAHRERAVPLALLAAELGLTPRAFADACRSHLGHPPQRAYAGVRMEHAAALLADTGLGVAQVAARLGFANPFHFSRAFKRVRGHPPSQASP